MKALQLPSIAVGAAVLLAGCSTEPTGDQPLALTVVQAPSAVGVPGWALIDTVTVRAQDQAGNPRTGVVMVWTVTAGSGSVEVLNDTTGADGISAGRWTLGVAPGANRLRVSVVDGDSVTFQSNGEVFKADGIAAQYILGCGLIGGAIWCWGDDFWGSTPPASDRGTFGWTNAGPALLDDSRSYTEVATGALTACGLDDQATAWCASSAVPVPAAVSGLPPVRGIVGAGNEQYCAIALSDSAAWCWGAGTAATPVPGSPAFARIWLGNAFTGNTACGLLSDSTAACWGSGPLGDGAAGDSPTPVSVTGGHKFVELAVGSEFACGRLVNGDVWCWGTDYGDFGVPPVDVLIPTFTVSAASRIAATEQDIQMLAAGAVVRWKGAGYSPVTQPSGVSGLAITGFTANGLTCLELLSGEARCVGEMYNRSSVWEDFNYVPVQPLRSP